MHGAAACEAPAEWAAWGDHLRSKGIARVLALCDSGASGACEDSIVAGAGFGADAGLGQCRLGRALEGSLSPADRWVGLAGSRSCPSTILLYYYSTLTSLDYLLPPLRVELACGGRVGVGPRRPSAPRHHLTRLAARTQRRQLRILLCRGINQQPNAYRWYALRKQYTKCRVRESSDRASEIEIEHSNN